MNAPLEYLYAAKIDQLASQLRAEGYEVTARPTGEDKGYDLVARKDNRKMAFEVKTIGDLKGSLAETRNLRKRAHEQGFDDFRLVIVSPPREVTLKVEGLDETLCNYLSDNLPEKLASLSPGARLDEVTDVEIDVLEVRKEGIHVAGTGVVAVELEQGGGNERDGSEAGDSFPFSFAVTLSHDLQIKEVHNLDVDTSSYYE